MSVNSKSNESNKIIWMLLVVSMTFFFLRLPSSIRKAFWKHYTGETTPLVTALRKFSGTLSLNIEYCNYAFNNYLYILPVKKFRQDVVTVLCCGRNKSKK